MCNKKRHSAGCASSIYYTMCQFTIIWKDVLRCTLTEVPLTVTVPPTIKSRLSQPVKENPMTPVRTARSRMRSQRLRCLRRRPMSSMNGAEKMARAKAMVGAPGFDGVDAAA